MSKTAIRIGLAKAFAGIPERNQREAQQHLTHLLLHASYPPETIFMSFIRKYGEESISVSVLALLQQAERLRTDPLYTLDSPSTTSLLTYPDQSESLRFNPSVWGKYCAKCELLIFNWASSAGIEYRRSAEDIYDSNATGRALMDVLLRLSKALGITKEHILAGTTLISQGDDSEDAL